MANFMNYSTRTSDEAPYFSSLFGATDVTRDRAKELPPPRDTAVVRRLMIDARDRFDVANTSPFDFRIYLDNAFRSNSTGVSSYENVTSVELKALAIPKVADEPYVIVNIDECNDSVLDSTSNTANRAYAVAYFDSDTMTTGTIKPIKGQDFYYKRAVLNPPLPRLDRMSIRFLKHDGTVVTLSDTANSSHVSLLFEITSVGSRRAVG
jgi:hypothetical protein